MKNLSRTKLNFANKAFLLLVFSSLMVAGCNKGSSVIERKRPTLTPKYILNGTYSDTDGIFDYYNLPNNELAVGLNSNYKTSQGGTINIEATHNDKKVTGIWRNAFHCSPATKVVLTNNIKVIDFEAFLYSSITEITIPYSVSEIGDAAFYCCDDLTTVKFVNSDQESSGSATSCYCDADGNPIGGGGSSQDITYCTLKKIPSYCFFKCDSLTTITFPSKIEEICEEAFNGCYSLNSPIYFQNIKRIRERAFQGCAALRKVYISKTLFTDEVGIEPHAFNYCSTAESPDNLDIVFCGDSETVSAWEYDHPNWGWYNDRNNPSGNKYTARVETGDTHFSADWDYTCDPNGDVTITHYNGPVPNADTGWFISVPDHMPTPENNRVVRISRDTFDRATRLALRRLYLPKTIVAIENNMFNIWQSNGQHVQTLNNNHFSYNNNNGYANLTVVDDNTKCVIDKGLFDNNEESNIEKRIDLSGLTELEFIGFRAFSGIGGNNNKGSIQKLRLPAKIRAIGDEAFGIFSYRMLPGVDEFTWEYDEANSRLETIGTDCFYGLGRNDTGEIKGNTTWKQHTVSTIIFPKTFKYFSVLGDDKTRYKNQAEHPFDFESFKPNKYQRPAHAFMGCSLLGKVIFKGGADSSDLVIPLQTFVYNESLRTIVFEERPGKSITFHTQQSTGGKWNYAQESIGGNSGRGDNDFRGEPFLQTLVLPNKQTKIRFQSFAFHANSRAVIYLSGNMGENMKSVISSDNDWAWTSGGNSVLTLTENDYDQAIQWKTIGDETRFDSKEATQKYWGYNFTPSLNGDYTNDKSIGTYDIDQQIPVYENVHYKEVLDIKNTPSNATDDLTVEVGNGNTIEYFEDTQGENPSYCSFVCGTINEINVATMTNYMYSLYDGKSSNAKKTAKVPETVTVKIGDTNKTFTVNKIGDSAFSACYCDGMDTDPVKTVGTFDDLIKIELPNTIVSIGDYAFIRAYGVTEIHSYSGNATATEGMPTSLKHIGKNAFLFTKIKQVLKIPNECRFYENYPTYQTGVIDDAETPGVPNPTTTCVFSSANDLRRISFWKNGQEVDSSDYYETTTYTSSDSTKHTCALYSKDHNDLSHNKDRLLLVFNRDNSDAKKPSANNADCETVSRNNSVVGLKFNGLYKTSPYLYGAFKMGYWILDLSVGNPIVDPSTSKPYPQPIISGVGTRDSNNSTLATKVIYLGKAEYTYDGLKCDLDTISGNVLELPEYAMTGCEKLANVELPIRSGGVIPEGVFAQIDNPNTIYYVRGDTPVAHTMNLTNSQYSEIGANVFKQNASIYYFTAPDVGAFTIGASAFESCTGMQTIDFSTVDSTLSIGSNAFNGCTNLTSIDFGSISGSVSIGASAFNGCTKLNTIDFGDVTGSLTINSSAFYNCGNGPITLDFSKVTGSLTIKESGFELSKVANIIWPTSNSCQVKIQKSAFSNCDSLTSVAIPSNIAEAIGESAFNDCDYLTTVTLPAGIDKNIGTNAFFSCDRLANVVVNGSSIAIKTFGEGAFSTCPLLSNFEFEKFTSLETIGKQAFYQSGILAANGEVTLPNKVKTIGIDAFRGSKIEVVVIQSSTIELGGKSFAECPYLTAVRFTNHDCVWRSYKDGVFNDNPLLTELQLPTGFDLNNQGTYDPNTNTYFIRNDSIVNLYTYTNYSPSVQTSPEWRATQNGVGEKSVHFFVSSVSDLITGSAISDPNTVNVNSSVLFWTTDANGAAVNLGYIVSYDGTTVTFSNGHTLTGSVFTNI